MPTLGIERLDDARLDVRALDSTTAMRLLEGILRFARDGSCDVKALHGELAGPFRLRLGDYRVLFTIEDDAMRIFGVRHRSEAYRLMGVPTPGNYTAEPMCRILLSASE